MARGILFLFWGVIFIFVDFNIDRFDLAPDFVGFLLIAIGSHILGPYTRQFRLVRHLALPALLLSLLIYGRTLIFLPQVLLIADTVLTVLVVWFLLGAVAVFSETRERPDLADHAKLYRKIYVGLAIATFLFQQAARVEPEAAGGFVDLMAAFGLVLLAFILRLLYLVKQELAADAALV